MAKIAKDQAITDWCARISERTSQRWRFVRVNQVSFETRRPQLLAEAVRRESESPAPALL